MKKLALIFCLIGCSLCTSANELLERNFYFSPGISIGHTFGAGLSYGFNVDAGFYKVSKFNTPVNAGLSFSRHWVQVKKYTHRISTLNLMLEGKNFDAKLGIGLVRNKWGYGKNNRCRALGTNMDISITADQLYAPWLGFRKFDYESAGWAWFGRPYSEAYVKYKYDVLGTSGLKQQNNMPF